MGRRALPVAMVALALALPGATASAQAPAAGSSSGGAVRQDDGRIVTIGGGDACGLPGTGCPRAFAVTRREANGALDPGFGAAGKAEPGIAGAVATSVAIDSQGRIVLAGTFEVSPFPQAQSGLVLARLLPSGDVDTSFGSNGVATVAVPGTSLETRGVVVAPDGTILVSTPYRTSSTTDLAVVRFKEDGSLDPGFGSAGIARASGGQLSVEDVGPIAVQPDGRILVGATTWSETFTRFLSVVRLEAGGSLDAGFAAGGVFSSSPVGSEWGKVSAQAVFTDSAGRVLLAGTERTGEHCCTETVVIRLDPSGQVDAGFGEGGGGDSGLQNASLLSAAPLADGRVFLAGSRRHSLLVARLGADGRLDPTFNAGGKGLVAVAGLNTDPTAALPQPDGGVTALAIVRGAHCRLAGRAGWRPCDSEATISLGANGFLRRGLGGVGFVTRPRIHHCPELPGTLCGIDMSERQLEGLAGRGSPRRAHLKAARFQFRVRCDRRIETHCRIATGVRLEPGRFTTATVSVKAGRSRLLRLPAPPSLARRLAAAGSELRLPLRQRVTANGLSVAFQAGIRLLRR